MCVEGVGGGVDWDGALQLISRKSSIEVVFLLAQPSLLGEGDIRIR